MSALKINLISFFIMIVLVTILNTDFSSMNPFDYARITDVEYKAVLVDEPNSNGKVHITERLTFDIHAASKDNLFWELWRDLPEQYVDGLLVSYDVKSVKQITDYADIPYQESPVLYWYDNDYISDELGPGKWYHSPGPYNESLRLYECVLFYVNGLYREKVVFEIEYEMKNAALRYNDSSELYLSMYSGDTIKHLNSFKGEILIPYKDMPKEGNYDAHTYGTNDNSFEFKESKVDNPGYHTFSFDLDKEDLKFRPYNNYLEFTLISFGSDKHIFTDYANHNLYSNQDVLDEIIMEQKKYDNEPILAKKKKTNAFVICISLSILTIFIAMIKLKNTRKRYKFYKPTTEMLYFRDIPSDLDPYFASKFIFLKSKKENDDGNGYSAILLNLIRKKYIELERINPNLGWDNNNINIVIKFKGLNTFQTAKVTNNTVAEKSNLVFIEQHNILESPVKKNPVDLFNPTNLIPNMEKEINENILEHEENFKSDLEALTPTEEYYFNLIIRHSRNNQINMSGFQNKVSSDYENTNTFVKNIEKSVVNIAFNKQYIQDKQYEKPKKQIKELANIMMIIGFISLIFVNLLSYPTRMDFAFGGFTILGITLILTSRYLKKESNKYLLFTQLGEDEYAKWVGLYNFLNSSTLMNEKTVIELPLWEKYLVYATAFGISEKVIKALKLNCPSFEASQMLSNPYYTSTNYRFSSHSFRSATRHATRTYNTHSYSGGFGGHGGYGGGGRGGGGGGGGH